MYYICKIQIKKMGAIDRRYQLFLNSNLCQDKSISIKEFANLLIHDDEINRMFGQKITRKLTLGERMKIAFKDDEKEMIKNLYSLGTKNMICFLNKSGIQKRKIFIRESLKEKTYFLDDNFDKSFIY